MTFHERHRPVMTVGLFEAEEPSRCGIADIDGNGVIVGFEEKPAQPRSNLANAGLYVAEAELFDRLPAGTPADFGQRRAAVTVRGHARLPHP